MNRSRSLLKYSLSLPLAIAPLLVALAVPNVAQAAANGTIAGVVTNSQTREKIEGAVVVAQCACLQGTRETTTNADGLYTFRNLPPGAYTVQVLYGKANMSKSTTLERSKKLRANFAIDPKNTFRIDIVVDAAPVRSDTAVSTKVDMERTRNIPVGSASRDFTSVVDTSPVVDKDAAGLRI
ncbi:MAG TPA: carboxypeptidase regulatory-like domain-containing protein, partial [Nannocystis exedens]|nr:carboxypeptidase regulatory-like domain-containing protein [Nannocystis exedens]